MLGLFCDLVPGVPVHRCGECGRVYIDECPHCPEELLALRGDPRPLRELVPLVLRYGPTTAPEVARILGCAPDSARRVLSGLVDDGHAHRPEHGLYVEGPGS